MNKKLTIILAVIIYLSATGVSYFFFAGKSSGNEEITSRQDKISTQTDSTTGNDYQAVTFDASTPKTEECPLNGAMYSKDQKDWWIKHRPLGVMIENSTDSRPQSGIYFADIVYEAVAEGGITRTLNVFYCQDAGIVGPVRSARTYFLDFISEYGEYPLYAHVGGANTPGPANALGQISDYGWAVYNDLNQFSIGFPTFWRDQSRLDHPVSTEHTMYSNTTKLWAVAEKRGLTNVDKKGNNWDTEFTPYLFKEDIAASERPTSQTINVPYWQNKAYSVDWVYDKSKNVYLRKNGGADHMDRNTKNQLGAKNVIILFMAEKNADDGYENNAHLLYGTKGKGKALVFIDGNEIQATWKKVDRTSRTILNDASGNELEFNRGQLWFQIVETDTKITVQ